MISDAIKEQNKIKNLINSDDTEMKMMIDNNNTIKNTWKNIFNN